MAQDAFLTKVDVADGFRRLGVRADQAVIVHASLSSLGYVLGAAQAVIEALLEGVGEQGTVVMPAFSPQVSDPVSWLDCADDDRQLEAARGHVPVFDPAITPAGTGAISEVFRTWPGVLRSQHPQVSVCARGPMAAWITSPHPFAWGQGTGSPFHRLYEIDAKLLLIGVGFNRATILHFAESLVPHGRRKTRRIPILHDGARNWIAVPDVGDDLNTHFPAIGEAFCHTGAAQRAVIGKAPCILAPSRAVVDFAKTFLSAALPA